MFIIVYTILTVNIFISQKEDNQLEDIELGTLLKKAREEKDLTLADLQEKTKIRKKYLEAIEKNDFEILPGKVYLKVFVKAYAREVDINYQELLNYYPVLTIEEKKEKTLKNDYLQGTKISANSNKKNNKGILKIIFILILILFLGATAVYTFQYFTDTGIRLLNQQQVEEQQLGEAKQTEKNVSESDSSDQENNIVNSQNESEKIKENSEVENPNSESLTENKNLSQIAANSSSENQLENQQSDLNEILKEDYFTESDVDIDSAAEIVEGNLSQTTEDNSNNLTEIEEETENLSQENRPSNLENNSELNSSKEESEIIISETNNTESETNNTDNDGIVENIESNTENIEDNTDNNSSAESELKPNKKIDKIVLTASDRVWLSIELDGENVYSGILEPGDQREFNLQERLYMKIGNDDAISAKIGDQDYGPWPGTNGISEVEIISEEDGVNINNLRN